MLWCRLRLRPIEYLRKFSGSNSSYIPRSKKKKEKAAASHHISWEGKRPIVNTRDPETWRELDLGSPNTYDYENMKGPTEYRDTENRREPDRVAPTLKLGGNPTKNLFLVRLNFLCWDEF